VVATANDCTKLPPELLRKGRWDELFFVDLPTTRERAAVLAAALRAHGRTGEGLDLPGVAAACPEFSGAEVAAIVPDAMIAAFGDGERPITTDDLITAARSCTPLARSAGEKIAALRSWAKGAGVRPASAPESDASPSGRTLDI
jgi:ATP-dependent 26S proteasome regulatory subunit